MTALAESRQEKIQYDVDFSQTHEGLFENHHWIVPVSKLDREPDFRLDNFMAMRDAACMNAPFGAGFFEQLGMNPVGQRFHYRSYFIESIPRESLKDHLCYGATIVVLNGYSCQSRDSHTGKLTTGHRPTVQMPYDHWKDILKEIPGKVYAMIGSKPSWDDEPFHYAERLPSMTMLEVLKCLKAAKLLVSVETGLLHLASATGINTVFLSSATPENFAKPKTNCAVVRAAYADEFPKDQVIQAALSFLA